MSPDVNRPDFRNINFDDLKDYFQSTKALLDGGADLILIETIFDTLNAKAAMMAIHEIEKELDLKIPLMLSATITDLSGRTFIRTNIRSLYNSVRHIKPISIGINCALGPKELDSYLKELSRFNEFFVSIHPNAGLPNAFGGYDETPEKMAEYAGNWSKDGYVNIIGGCCGTTPEHISKMKQAVKKFKPRNPRKIKASFRLSGLEPFNPRLIMNAQKFINIGERTNVTGSAVFNKLILNEKYEEPVSVAKQQVENGAQIIDINMDEGLLDSEKGNADFLKFSGG